VAIIKISFLPDEILDVLLKFSPFFEEFDKQLIHRHPTAKEKYEGYS